MTAAAQRIPAIPPRLRRSISRLALIHYAVSLGEERGREALTGKGAFGWKMLEVRSRAGKKTGAKNRASGKDTRAKALVERARLLSVGKEPREIAGMVASKIGKSRAQIRKIFSSEKKRA